MTIALGGAVAFDRPLRPCRFGCEPNDPTGGSPGSPSPTATATASPEVLVDRSDGFTPCCTLETPGFRRALLGLLARLEYR